MKFVTESSELLEHLMRMSGAEIPQSVNDLIEGVVRVKAWDLEMEFYSENRYLPKPIQTINLERKILHTNKLLESWKEKCHFNRSQEKDYSLNYEDINNEEEGTDSIISLCLACLDKEEYEQYLKFEISNEDLRKAKNWYRHKFGRKFEITLPKFDLMTKYLAYMEFYDSLIQDFEDLNSSAEIKSPTERYRFQTKFSENQIETMYQNFLEGGFIDSLTDKNEFLWSFGVAKSGFESSHIVWKKSKSLAVYFVDKLYSNNFLVNEKRFWAVGGKLFRIKKMAQIKQNYTNTNKSNKPKGYESIDKIIDLL